MILQRFSRAVQNQNWFAVVIEILTVVIGIFIGLQVDDWNENRKYRQQESVYLAKIADDLAATRAAMLDRNERYLDRINRMTDALYALEACDMSEAAQANVKFALEQYQSGPPISFVDATYNEMVASGALARIRDQKLKSKIALVFSQLGDLKASMRNFRISIPIVDTIVWDNVSYSVDRETGGQVASFDMAGLCENTKMRNAVVEMIDLQTDSNTAMRFGIASAEELLGMLTEYTGDAKQ